jgi:uncharacterized protein (TIGR02145 family)
MATKRNINIDVKRIMLNKVRLSGISLIIMACFSTMSFGGIDSKKINIPDTTSNEVLFGFVNEYINAMNLFAKNNYPAKEQLNIAGDFFLQKGEGNVVLDFPGIKPAESFLIGSYLTQMKLESIILKYKENLTIQRCLHNGLLNEGILIEKIIINKKNNEIKEVKEFLKIKKDNFGKLKIELLFSSIFPKSFEEALCEENKLNSLEIMQQIFKPTEEKIDIDVLEKIDILINKREYPELFLLLNKLAPRKELTDFNKNKIAVLIKIADLYFEYKNFSLANYLYTNILAMGFILEERTRIELSKKIATCQKNNDSDNIVDFVTDVEGNYYPTFKFGNQEWFLINLKTAKYKNGESINEVAQEIIWRTAKTGAWCYYKNDKGFDDIGKLYNGYAILDKRGICPEGWSVPTNQEWQKLIDFLGGKKNAVNQLKSSNGWYQGKNGNSNSIFSGYPLGSRNVKGEFAGNANYTDWWTSTMTSTYSLYIRSLSFSSDDVYEDIFNYNYGLSVRCIKNNN